MTLRKGLGSTLLWAGLALAALVALAPPCAAAEDVPQPAAATAPENPCAATGSIEVLLAPDLSPAASADTLDPLFGAHETAPPFLRRTCRCSCGYPCTTHADCGPGGFCSAGITCC